MERGYLALQQRKLNCDSGIRFPILGHSVKATEESMQWQALSKIWRTRVAIFTALCGLTSFTAAQQYKQTNLDSDIQGLASNPPAGTPDTKLLNPWGITAGPGTPFWVADNNGGVSTLYNGAGALLGVVVNIPPNVNGAGTGTPTGTVFSGGLGFQVKGNGKTTPAIFLFCDEDGHILG